MHHILEQTRNFVWTTCQKAPQSVQTKTLTNCIVQPRINDMTCLPRSLCCFITVPPSTHTHTATFLRKQFSTSLRVTLSGPVTLSTRKASQVYPPPSASITQHKNLRKISITVEPFLTNLKWVDPFRIIDGIYFCVLRHKNSNLSVKTYLIINVQIINIQYIVIYFHSHIV